MVLSYSCFLGLGSQFGGGKNELGDLLFVKWLTGYYGMDLVIGEDWVGRKVGCVLLWAL